MKLDRKTSAQRIANLSIVVLFLVMAATPTRAQDIFGVISGTVTDPTGAVVPAVKITIQNDDTKETRSGSLLRLYVSGGGATCRPLQRVAG